MWLLSSYKFALQPVAGLDWCSVYVCGSQTFACSHFMVPASPIIMEQVCSVCYKLLVSKIFVILCQWMNYVLFCVSWWNWFVYCDQEGQFFVPFCTFPILTIYHFSTAAEKGLSENGLLEFISKLDISILPLLNLVFTLK